MMAYGGYGRGKGSKEEGGQEHTALSVAELEEHSQTWLLDCQVRQLAPSTLGLRRVLLGRFFRYLKENGHTEVDTGTLRTFLAAITSQGLSAKSVLNYYTDLRCFYAFLREQGLLNADPFDALRRPRVPKHQVQPFTGEQVRALIGAARHSRNPKRNEALLLLLVDTAGRASEICGLRMADLDLPNRRCQVLGKGRKRRTLPMSEHTASALGLYLQEQEGERRPEDPVFTSARTDCAGRALTRHGLYDLVRELAKDAGLAGPRVGPHRLRHTAAITYLRAGGDVFSLRDLLGHTDLRQASTYLAITQADVEAKHAKCSPVKALLG